MTVHPIATFHSPFPDKFGIPRQSGIVNELRGYIELAPEYRQEDIIRGIEGYDYLWLLWHFSANSHAAKGTTVRPPLLGGNQRMGVLATRSPFRPNPIGLSSVRLLGVEMTRERGPLLHVAGADLMDGTPIFDIKPYLPYADAHPDARGGFTDEKEWLRLEVIIPQNIEKLLAEEDLITLKEILSLDPRPHYHNNAEKHYHMRFYNHDVCFSVDGNQLIVHSI